MVVAKATVCIRLLFPVRMGITLLHEFYSLLSVCISVCVYTHTHTAARGVTLQHGEEKQAREYDGLTPSEILNNGSF